MSVRTRTTARDGGPNRVHWPCLAGLLALSATSFSAIAQNAITQQGSTASSLRLDERTPFFQLVSRDLYGARGQEQLEVSIRAACGGHQWAFDHAELLVGNVRYGGAFIRSAPDAGCTDCAPLIVDWYHEPTGQLSFSVNVFRRQIFIPCDPQVPESPRE